MARHTRAEERIKGPVTTFSIILLLLMMVVTVFLVLVQNVDRFSEFFGSTTLRIITDIALVCFIGLFAAYLLIRGREYRKNLEGLIERLQKSNQLLQVLNTIQSTANSTLDVPRLLEEALEAVMPLTSSLGTIYLYDEEEAMLKPWACCGTGTPLQELPSFSPGEGIVGKVAQAGEPLVDDGKSGSTTRETNMNRIALPIKAGNKVMGVLLAGKASGSYSDEERTLLHAVSEVLGNSLTNAKLYDLTRRALDTSKKTQRYMEGFIHEAKIGVLVLDNRGIVMVSNREAERYLALESKDLLGQNIFEVLARLDRKGQQLAEGFRSSFKDRLGLQFTHTLEEDPSRPAIRVNVFPLFAGEDELIGAAATFFRQ